MPSGIYNHKPHTAEHKDNIRKAMLGRKITWADKISKAHTGKIKPWAGNNLKEYNKLPRTDEFRQSVSKHMKGRKHTLGLRFTIIPDELKVTPLQNSIRRSKTYRLWRTSIFERDNYTCVMCRQRGGNLNVDHIEPFGVIFYRHRLKTLQGAYDCDELWDKNNARTLCESCHKTTETYGKKVKAKK